jgi:hypothetical protein
MSDMDYEDEESSLFMSKLQLLESIGCEESGKTTASATSLIRHGRLTKQQTPRRSANTLNSSSNCASRESSPSNGTKSSPIYTMATKSLPQDASLDPAIAAQTEQMILETLAAIGKRDAELAKKEPKHIKGAQNHQTAPVNNVVSMAHFEQSYQATIVSTPPETPKSGTTLQQPMTNVLVGMVQKRRGWQATFDCAPKGLLKFYGVVKISGPGEKIELMTSETYPSKKAAKEAVALLGIEWLEPHKKPSIQTPYSPQTPAPDQIPAPIPVSTSVPIPASVLVSKRAAEDQPTIGRAEENWIGILNGKPYSACCRVATKIGQNSFKKIPNVVIPRKNLCSSLVDYLCARSPLQHSACLLERTAKAISPKRWRNRRAPTQQCPI